MFGTARWRYSIEHTGLLWRLKDSVNYRALMGVKYKFIYLEHWRVTISGNYFDICKIIIYIHIYIYIKVKFSRFRPGVAQRVGRGMALLFHEWSAARPGRTLPPGNIRYPFYKRLGRPQGQSGRAENLVPTGFRSQTVQSVVSRYTGWATRSTIIYIYIYTHTHTHTHL